jgi:hypothetical protein
MKRASDKNNVASTPLIIKKVTPVFNWVQCRFCHYEFKLVSVWKITLTGHDVPPTYVCTECCCNEEYVHHAINMEKWHKDMDEYNKAQPPKGR